MERIVITGANGQLGRALQKVYSNPDAVTALSREQLDITNPEEIESFDWNDVDIIINAAAYTKVDAAETPEEKDKARKVNVEAIHNLGRIAMQHDLTLVHVSSEYVFDGTKKIHSEDESPNPLSVYGQTKADGDKAAENVEKHYIIRTSWVVGDGNNFVKTMKSLANRGIKPSVVDDQIGRLTFADDLASGIKHLLDTKAPYGTYNLTNDGDSASWCEIAKRVYDISGASSNDVRPVSTEEYYKDKECVATRPKNSTLDLAKIKSTGFYPPRWEDKLSDYLGDLQ